MNLWKKLVSDPINDVYIILEDDAELTENFNKKLKICYEEFLNNNMEILYLGSNSYTKRNTDINNLQFISRKQISTEGTYAYMISKMGAFKILNYIKNNGIKTAIDGPQFYNQLISVNYTNESIIGSYFTFADSDIQRHTHKFSFDGINLN
jgi:GR25 family glycosyltransferase involved in LPS biosynthesis